MTFGELLDYIADAMLVVLVVGAGALSYYVFAPMFPEAWMPTLLHAIGELWARVGLAFPILALFAGYLVVVTAWLGAERLGFTVLPFDPRRHLHYVESTAPLLGLLSTSLAMAQAMQGFEPASGMLSTSRFLVQHAGQAMWATAAGIAEAYVAHTVVWLFALDTQGAGS